MVGPTSSTESRWHMQLPCIGLYKPNSMKNLPFEECFLKDHFDHGVNLRVFMFLSENTDQLYKWMFDFPAITISGSIVDNSCFDLMLVFPIHCVILRGL